MDKITSEKIRKNLTARVVGSEIFCYDKLASTNIEAKENASFPEGSVFVAEEQTAGRGRLSRSWSSEAGAGIYMSILLKPSIAAEQVSCITLICGLAVCRALGNAGIKWPNDVVIGGKKVCGILTERLTGGEIIAGVGVNVNNSKFPEELADIATSLYIEEGKRRDRNMLLAKILNELDSLYAEFLAGGFSAVREEYIKNCVTLGKRVRIITPAGEYEAEAVSIAENGGLVIMRGGKTEVITSGEVSVRRI